jgi:hypothetical protein
MDFMVTVNTDVVAKFVSSVDAEMFAEQLWEVLNGSAKVRVETKNEILWRKGVTVYGR